MAEEINPIMNNTVQLFDYYVSDKFPGLPVKEQTIINTINPHSYCVAKKDLEFQKALIESSILLPDGIGIVMAAKVLKGKKIQKISGYDLFLNLMDQLNKNDGTCFFLGAAPKTLIKIRERIQKEYPNVKVSSFSPPYKPSFSEEESRQMCKKVNAVSPDVLFVGMTAPKQEKWVNQNKNKLDVNIICSIGAVFDFYSGTINRAPSWLIKLGLEWLHRVIQEPSRLGKRSLASIPPFLIDVVKSKFKVDENYIYPK